MVAGGSYLKKNRNYLCRDVTDVTTKIKKDGYDWRPKFIELLRKFGVVTYAAEGAGISRTTAYRYRNQSEKFAKQWEDAIAASIHVLEQEARERALSKSDTLLIFLLKSLKPEVYHERYRIEHSGTITHEAEPTALGWLERVARRPASDFEDGKADKLAVGRQALAEDDTGSGRRG